MIISADELTFQYVVRIEEREITVLPNLHQSIFAFLRKIDLPLLST